MKPSRPRTVSSTRNYITIAWDPCDSLILKSINKSTEENRHCRYEKEEKTNDDDNLRWYLLERKDRVLSWISVYMGFKTQTEVGPLAPCDYYEFRLKVKTSLEESDWSNVLFALTKEDVIPISQLHRAVENGPVTSLRKIINQRLSSVEVPNKYGHSALRLAIQKNNTNFMGILLTQGAADVGNTEKGSGRTPLMVACALGHLEAAQLLLEKGSLWNTKDNNGMTALNYAVDNSHLQIVKLAVECQADLHTKDKFGWSPLMRAVVLKSSPQVISYLLESGSDPNDTDDNRQQTVLMQAVLSCRPEVITLLLDKGANVQAKNIYQHSAYDMAKNSPNEVIVKMSHLLLTEEMKEDDGKSDTNGGFGNKNRKQKYFRI